MARGRKKKKMYFDVEVEEAIIEYNTITDNFRKERLFNDIIHPALKKLSENLIHKYKFYYYDTTYRDLKHATIAFVLSKLHMYTEGKGKAFSYFSIVARNYLIVQNRAMFKSISEKEDLAVIDDERNLNVEINEEERASELKDFIDLWVEWMDSTLEDHFTESEMDIADSIIELFKIRENIEIFNKKYLYILIRERTGKSNTQNITSVVNKVKNIFYKMYKIYLNTGKVDFDEYLLVKEEDDDGL